jgi:hypothetical protein
MRTRAAAASVGDADPVTDQFACRGIFTELIDDGWHLLSINSSCRRPEKNGCRPVRLLVYDKDTVTGLHHHPNAESMFVMLEGCSAVYGEWGTSRAHTWSGRIFRP